MITYFPSARPPYRGLPWLPQGPHRCPSTLAAWTSPSPVTLPLSPVTAEVTLTVLIPLRHTQTCIHKRLLIASIWSRREHYVFTPTSQTSKWHHSASVTQVETQGVSLDASLPIITRLSPPASTQSCQLFPPTHTQFIHFLLTSQPPPDCAIIVSRVDYCKKF